MSIGVGIAGVERGDGLAGVAGVGHVPADVAGLGIAEDGGGAHPGVGPDEVVAAVPQGDGFAELLVGGEGAATLAEVGGCFVQLGLEESEAAEDVLLPVPDLQEGGYGCGELAESVALIEGDDRLAAGVEVAGTGLGCEDLGEDGGDGRRDVRLGEEKV